jgi:hypothetical protein
LRSSQFQHPDFNHFGADQKKLAHFREKFWTISKLTVFFGARFDHFGAVRRCFELFSLKPTWPENVK